MAVTLEAVKFYARIDGDVDDTLLESLISAAASYLDQAGIQEGKAPPNLYQLAVCGIVLHWYECRNATGQTLPADFAPGIRHVINQLKLICQISSYTEVAT